SSVVQDKDGYIWIATTNGLQRYDGSSFITFKSSRNNPQALPSNHIYALFKDSRQNLWLLSENQKVGTFDTKKFVFKEVPLEVRGAGITIRHFFEGPGGQIMLITVEGHFFRFDESRQIFILQDEMFPKPSNWKCNEIVWDAVARKYWLGCDSGLVQFDPFSKRVNYRGHNPDNDPVINAFKEQRLVNSLFTDAKGNLTYSSWPPRTSFARYFRYYRKTGQVKKYEFVKQLGYHEHRGVLQQRNGRIWFYGMPFFGEWTDDSPDLNLIANEYRGEQSIKFDYANHAFEDKESNIWIATDNGLYIFNPDAQIFNTFKLVRPDGKPAIEAPVQALAELDNGKIIVGCWGAGIFCYDQDLNPAPVPRSISARRLSVWDMAINHKTRDLWITLQAGGLIVYNQKSEKAVEIYPEIFKRSTIRQVDEDTSGNLWFGTHNGALIKWDLKKSGNDPSKGYELVYESGMSHKVHFDYKGYIWLATLGHGIVKLDAKTYKVVKTFTSEGKEGERLFMNSPGDMTYYDDTTLIVSAGCLNIINTRTNKISYISADHGLPSNTTESVERDEKGTIWAGMTNGICRINLKRKLVTYYDRRDGIAWDKFNLAGVKELRDGRIVFFTDHNFLVFDPKRFGQQSLPPKPYITGFKLAGNALSLDSILWAKRAILKYSNTSISVNFSALSYLQQQKMHYYYMLDPLDKDWIRTDRPVEVTYNYLPPGQYVFKVKSENADGIASQDIATLPIVVRAPAWKTWWFYSLIGLLLIVILYLIDRERVKRRRSLLQVRTQIAKNLTDDISSTLNNINVLSEIAKIKADKNVEQSKDFIDQISDKSRHMIEAMDDMLWSIAPENDSMKQTVLRIKEVTDGMRIASDTEIDLIVDNKIQLLELDMKVRHEFFFFYKEALAFLLSNNQCRQIFVNINRVKSKLFIEILSECQDTADDFRVKFAKAVDRRVKALSADMDIMADNKSFSVILYVDIK
ncbi:MAG TPA: two-component regulator propeller domain-containing protein, partial [Flavisolibacter sp.]|nr:two-component regulator propeller domain-containing protein [Flavisolibacter sp.]